MSPSRKIAVSLVGWWWLLGKLWCVCVLCCVCVFCTRSLHCTEENRSAAGHSGLGGPIATAVQSETGQLSAKQS